MRSVWQLPTGNWRWDTLPGVKLTVTVITLNESAQIAAALQSVEWADEILVIDSRSTDDTVTIARAHAARVEAA